MNRRVVVYYAKNIMNFNDYPSFLESVKINLIEILRRHSSVEPIKYNLKLEASYNKPLIDSSTQNRDFKTSAKVIFADTDIAQSVSDDYSTLIAEEDKYMERGSGFTLQKIDGISVSVYKYTPLGGSSYIETPVDIINKKSTINPQNNDQQCFKWSVLARHVTGDNKHRVGENYTKHEQKYNFTGLSFPTPLSEVKGIFEKNNCNVSVNVYGLKQRKRNNVNYNILFPLKVVKNEKKVHFDLLLLSNGENNHYIYISNFNSLVRSQLTSHKESIWICKSCFTSFDDRPRITKSHGQVALEEHKLICGENKPIRAIMPLEGENTLEFKNWANTQRHPIVIYADFEALLVKCDESKGKSTSAFQKHKPMSYGLYVKAADDIPLQLLTQYGIPTAAIIYRGSLTREEVARHFVETVSDLARKIEEMLKTNKPIVMTSDEGKTHAECITCNLCKNKFSLHNHKVADHCHLTGQFRQSLCNSCNLKLQSPNFVPCYFHNLTNYDAHFIVTELGYDSKSINVIPNSEEKFISFSKFISNRFTIRFIDTIRFMPSKLSTLAKNLISANFYKFRETSKEFNTLDLPLVTRKGVYPYEYTDSWDKLEETQLPRKEHFYSSLKEKDVTEEEYEHAKNVWNHFKCKTLGEYSDLYLKVDVMLLVDIYENFRDICLSVYSIDPAFYFTSPGMSFDCMLKNTGVKLNLLTDYDMLLMFEKGKSFLKL